jgi:hypothetical protein
MNKFTVTPANFDDEEGLLGALPEEPVENPNPELALLDISMVQGQAGASVEFVLDHEGLDAPELLGERLRGPGIYLRDQPPEGADRIPFWAVVRSQEFTRAQVQKIVSQIASIVESKEYEQRQYWKIG